MEFAAGAKTDTLVILSLPFQRLIRSHLSPMVLEILTKRADVVIVSPFAEHPEFVNQYAGARISHVLAPTHKKLPWLFRKLVGVSSILRMQGYRYRIRKHLPYYWANRHVVFGESGNDIVAPLSKRVVMDILALIGSWQKAWTLLDRVIGRWSFYMSALAAVAGPYQRVTLIQASSWGFQDQALAWMGRKYRWRTVLLPYTTDQLMTNGYLYSNFDVVCIQGPVEKRFGSILHGVSPSRILKLGATYMRVLKAIAADRNAEATLKTHKQLVMYAGLVPTYFPAACEIEAVNMLSGLDVGKDTKGLNLIYRPAAFSEDWLVPIKRKLTFPDRVELQIPSSTSLGLGSYSATNSNQDLIRLLTDLEKVDVLVTSLTTSLSIEAALMGVPCISYYPKANAMLSARKTHLLFDKENRTIGMESVPVANDLQELGVLVKQLLSDSVMRRKIADATLREWNYQDSNYVALLEGAVFGDS